jgi:hypothetical protein
MNLDEKIIQQIHDLPDHKKAEVLDFVQYLRTKNEELAWAELSLGSALHGMEDDSTPYSLDDLKESFS